jgi:two-component system chemotaxis sensor kinase CheA
MTGSDAEFRERLLATFRSEAEEYLSVITAGLITLEKSGSAPDPDLIEQVYRKIHSLKGAARAVNIREIEQVCQNFESVFAAIKRGTFTPNPEDFDIFHRAIQVTRVLLSGKKQQGISSEEVILALRNLIPQDERSSKYPGQIHAASAHISSIVEAGGALPGTGTKSVDVSGQAKELPIPAALPGGARVMPDFPGIQPGNGDTVRIVSYKLDRLISGSDDLLATRLFITHRMHKLQKMMTRFNLWQWNQALMSSDIHLIRETLSGTKQSTLPAELVIPLKNIIRFLEYDREFIVNLKYDLAEHVSETERDRAALEASTSEISDLIHDAVLLPVTSILVQFSGFIREYSRSLGKTVDYSIEGEGIEMDRRILETLKDPLMHLINNCIDHGIEFPDIRKSRKKPTAGVIRIRVVPLTGSRVGIEVSDDGAGIDGREIRNTAIRNGLISVTEGENLTDEAAKWLIFKSGFSTNPVVTDISGRGLGLAIVEDTVTRLGGDLLLSTQPGKGTSITLRLPVRLATLRGVVVRSGRQVYVLPIQQVRQVIRIRPSEITTHDEHLWINVSGEMIRLIRLTDALETTDYPVMSERTKQITIVVLAYGAGQIACMVDEIIQEQEIIVRPLGSQLRRVRRITGAVILGDGTVALVLDPLALIQEARRLGEKPFSFAAPADARLTVLVVEDSVTTMFLLQTILEDAGFSVMTATDGMNALALLRDHRFDMVVSDVDMPRMNGFLLTEKIRADPSLSKIPVVLVTSLGSAEDRHQGMAVGADAYLVKSSFTTDRFLKIVRNLAEGVR